MRLSTFRVFLFCDLEVFTSDRWVLRRSISLFFSSLERSILMALISTLVSIREKNETGTEAYSAVTHVKLHCIKSSAIGSSNADCKYTVMQCYSVHFLVNSSKPCCLPQTTVLGTLIRGENSYISILTTL